MFDRSVGGNDVAVVRYNSDGSLDTSFGGTGKVTTDFQRGNGWWHQRHGPDAQQRSVVIGAPARLTSDILVDLVTARVQLNDQEVAAGLGSAVLGNPLNSITWLADKLGQYERRLKPGDIIMSGSFVRQFPLKPGDVAVAEFSGIGRVETRIAAV